MTKCRTGFTAARMSAHDIHVQIARQKMTVINLCKAAYRISGLCNLAWDFKLFSCCQRFVYNDVDSMHCFMKFFNLPTTKKY